MKYQFNDNGVCINPDEVFHFERKGLFISVHTAQVEHGFLYGYSIDVNDHKRPCCGCAHPIVINDPPVKMTRIEIVKHVLKLLPLYLSNVSDEALINEINAIASNYGSPQLTLFP